MKKQKFHRRLFENKKIGPEEIFEIQAEIDIVDLVSKYAKRWPDPRNILFLCPFHDEKVPSFIIDTDEQEFKCFGCGADGDIFKFIELIHNTDLIGAVKILKKMIGDK